MCWQEETQLWIEMNIEWNYDVIHELQIGNKLCLKAIRMLHTLLFT